MTALDEKALLATIAECHWAKCDHRDIIEVYLKKAAKPSEQVVEGLLATYTLKHPSTDLKVLKALETARISLIVIANASEYEDCNAIANEALAKLDDYRGSKP
jgi:hypothetical protein